MKKLFLAFLFLCLLGISAFAAPGDIVEDHYDNMWLIATRSGMLSGLISDMNAMPEAYMTVHSQDEWSVYLKIKIALDFDKIFHSQVYADVLSKIIGYNYGNTRIADEYKAPSCVVNSSDIECDEDPTEKSRSVILWQRTGGQYVEQSITATLSAGTWTFAAVPTGSNYTVVYDDNFASFPTLYLTIP